MKKFFRKLFRIPEPVVMIPMHIDIDIDQVHDIMDPHGDGSIRPGDTMWEVFQHIQKTGKGVIGAVDDEGNLTFSDYPEEPKA